ncbi:YopX family protein [Brevibacillus laterosporus]|uniref:YopX family protein n=1 Tax=Brevibacillus laterosporus TaxID=1465 RepID=A0AAP3GE44_BRELA|nr:YopX family protein [Brevibacillus laterosporus]MCR8982633.1 YopX family protein [Brevibacillus laterosporus]MCZ0809789.1 YopX family protein [Brevibacillus laterosporus]MCZ0828377.1 YopX family protein [Brevibacillus laterosporus]MCZ0852387.1 YopX family protein [Brevibacillus laterosporus]
MREAKYQAWFDGEMISDWYPRTQFRICTGWDNKIGLETFSTMEEGIFNGEPVALPVWKSANGAKLRQYTGLHDKNGKEIYEGDIIKRHFEIGRVVINPISLGAEDYEIDDSGYFIGVVSYRPSEGYVLNKCKKFNDDDELQSKKSGVKIYPNHAVVIGNIYEHPHLLNPE